jgi:hypothetical protein
MNTIWKVSVPPVVGVHEVRLPDGSTPFIAGYDPGGLLCVWARVDDKVPLVTYFIHVAWTGMKLSEDAGTHLGTFVIKDFVYHVFDDKENGI